MSNAQRRAINSYRSRLSQQGFSRLEILARDGDRDLIKTLARQLAEDGPDADRLRALLGRAVAGEPERTGSVLAALRRSPLVGADLHLTRERGDGRKVDL